MGRGGSKVVSMLTFYSDDPSSNPQKFTILFCKLPSSNPQQFTILFCKLLEKSKNTRKRGLECSMGII